MQQETLNHQLHSVLSTILDPSTRQHAAMHQGPGTSFDTFKNAALEFINATAGPDDDRMQIGAFGAESNVPEDVYDEKVWGEWEQPVQQMEETLMAFRKGKGKGKGKATPKGGCWTCGGPHYASACHRVLVKAKPVPKEANSTEADNCTREKHQARARGPSLDAGHAEAHTTAQIAPKAKERD